VIALIYYRRPVTAIHGFEFVGASMVHRRGRGAWELCRFFTFARADAHSVASVNNQRAAP
jgi:hypothetical protein